MIVSDNEIRVNKNKWIVGFILGDGLYLLLNLFPGLLEA